MFRSERQSLGLLIVTVCMLQVGSAAWADSSTRPGKTDIVAVQLGVVKDGDPVSGLSADDFLVRDKGKNATVVAVREVDFASAGEGLPEEAYRQLFLLFDLEFSDPRFVIEATDLARELIRSDRLANSRVMIATHAPSVGLRIEQQRTGDRKRLLKVLSILHDEQEARLGSFVATAGPIVKGDDLITARASNLESEKGIVQREQGRILGLIQSLSRLQPLTMWVPGSAQVVVFSPGFDSSVILGNQATQLLDAAWSVEQSEAAARGQVSTVNDATRYGGGVVETALFEMLSEYSRSGVPIQTVILELEGDGRPVMRGAQGPNGLTIMAEKTGGAVFAGSDDTVRQLSAMLQPIGSTYLLTFEPGGSPQRGRYRRLEVKLKNSDSRIQLLAPPGYFVP